MKKSEIYRLAQIAVVDGFNGLNGEQKIAIMRELIEREDLERFLEEQEADGDNE